MSKFNLRASRLLLAVPHHDSSLLPVPRRAARPPSLKAGMLRIFRSVNEKQKNLQAVDEFRKKLRLAEDLISKLAFSLREIQGARRKTKGSDRKAKSKLAAIQSIGRSRN